MAMPSSAPAPWEALGPDPGRAIRRWVAFLLRMGVGLSLLGSGLVGYFGAQNGMVGARPWLQSPSASMLEPFLLGLPYVAIGLGLALILGFLTKVASIAAGFFSLLVPIFAIIEVVLAGRGTPGNWQFYTPGSGVASNLAVMMTTNLPTLLTQAALIWLSPLENHPYSVDALIFGRNEMEPAPPAEVPARPEDAETLPIDD